MANMENRSKPKVSFESYTYEHLNIGANPKSGVIWSERAR
jgi:hypothetical protein